MLFYKNTRLQELLLAGKYGLVLQVIINNILSFNYSV